MSRVVYEGIVGCESRIDILSVFGHKPLEAVEKHVVELRCLIRGIVESCSLQIYLRVSS
jgi:hypothetical protein